MKVHYYNNLVERGLAIKGVVLIEESTLNEIVWYLVKTW